MEYYYVRFYDRAEKEPSYYSNPAFLGVWQSGFDMEGCPIMVTCMYVKDEVHAEEEVSRMTGGKYVMSTVRCLDGVDGALERHGVAKGGNRFEANEFIRQRIINAGKFNYTINYRIG